MISPMMRRHQWSLQQALGADDMRDRAQKRSTVRLNALTRAPGYYSRVIDVGPLGQYRHQDA
jgi:hypothetical protein